ncbi:hypothetical protein Vafri_9480 [Volvox africanus]|uniref:Uncharacterized protein n=1 Tax=Volvox africanus TaxID=51714 RepID=A0A8J4EZQ0_9CHLO|nr:hypothetical protein Vafri_9480 [Volvox africanus]
MAAGGGVQFLQSNVEDGAKGMAAYKPQNTEVIRKMLREQQRECQALHANPLFKEFRTPGSVRAKKFGKGYAVIEDAGMPQPFADPKSIEYEGQARMFELIKNTAVKEEKVRQGVWASFGAPYVPLGDPKELEKTLPELNRDKMGSRDGQRNGPRRKNSKQSSQHQQAAATVATAPGGGQPAAAAGSTSIGGGGSRRRRAGSSGNAAADARPGSPGSAGYDSDSLPGYGSSADADSHLSPAEAAIRAATREAEDTVNKQKSVMRFSVNDRIEASFPASVLTSANVRAGRARASVGAFVNRREAEDEVTDPHRAYGQPPPVRRQLMPLPPAARRIINGGGGGVEESVGVGEGSTFFLTQQAGQAAQDEERRRTSLENGAIASTSAPYDGTAGVSTGASGLVPGGPPPADGSFMPLVEPVVALRGDESNPVYKWHNDFMSVRQSGRAQLQAALFARAQGRASVRTEPSNAAGLSTTLFGVLNLTQGRMPTFASGGKVVSPYARLEQYQAAQEAARRNTKQKAVQALDPSEIRILQRFYDQLCALVEVQRMSDPLCLMVVSKVKLLLEAGVYLHKPMLVAVLEHVAAFAKGAGMMRYNKYLLAVLTFITKCVGLDVADLEEAVEQQGVSMVVYGTPVVPSKVTSDIVAALGGADDEGTGSGTASGAKASGRTRSARPHAKHGGSGATVQATISIPVGTAGEGTNGEGTQGDAAPKTSEPLMPAEMLDSLSTAITNGSGCDVVGSG